MSHRAPLMFREPRLNTALRFDPVHLEQRSGCWELLFRGCHTFAGATVLAIKAAPLPCLTTETLCLCLCRVLQQRRCACVVAVPGAPIKSTPLRRGAAARRRSKRMRLTSDISPG